MIRFDRINGRRQASLRSFFCEISDILRISFGHRLSQSSGAPSTASYHGVGIAPLPA